VQYSLGLQYLRTGEIKPPTSVKKIKILEKKYPLITMLPVRYSTGTKEQITIQYVVKAIKNLIHANIDFLYFEQSSIIRSALQVIGDAIVADSSKIRRENLLECYALITETLISGGR
jgi:hypothetical protein